MSKGVSTETFFTCTGKIIKAVANLSKERQQAAVLSGASKNGLLSFTLLANKDWPELRLDFLIDSRGHVSLECPQLSSSTSGMRELQREIFGAMT